MEVVEQSSVRRYSTSRLRSLIAMVGQRAFRLVNGSAGHLLFKPLVVLAARVLGPGPTRLRLVKLAHNLNHAGVVFELAPQEYDADQEPAVQPTRRAA